MSTEERSRREAKITIERTYRASAQDVWDLWTTKGGFESWWGPQGFRVEVHELDARVGGALRYDMIAATPEMITAMQQMGAPISHPTTSSYAELRPYSRLVLRNVIDFLPGVEAYESHIAVDLFTVGDRTRMVVTLDAMHNDDFTKMQEQGFTSQLTKLDERFV